MNRVFKEIESLKTKYEQADLGREKSAAAHALQEKRAEWERLRQKTTTSGVHIP